ncbi:MAG: hypothetical protein IPH57_14865 [Saprospiraceae bacterium]|nr:hypothetical protein [Saprospiraceae bacterium]
MKYLKILIIVLCFNVFGFSQKVKIDFVFHKDPAKTEYRINDIFTEINKIRTGKKVYLKFDVIDSISGGNAPYICEIWEFGESLEVGIFRDTRYTTKYDSKTQKEVKTSYIAAGVKVEAISKFFIRIYERETGEILDAHEVTAHHIQEIADDEVKTKYKQNQSNQALEDLKLIKYESRISKIRNDIISYFASDFNKLLNKSFSFLVPPPMLTGINEKKEDKIKEILIDQYHEKEIDYAWSNCDINIETDVLNRKVYKKIGTAFNRPEDLKKDGSEVNILGVYKGQKELGAYIEKKSKIYILENPEKDPYLAGKYNGEKKYYDFMFFIEPLSFYDKYSLEHKKIIELSMQSHFLKTRDIKAIANNPFTARINDFQINGTGDSKPETTEDFKIEDVTKNELIFVTIPATKKEPKLSLKIKPMENDNKDRYYTYPVIELSNNNQKYKETLEFTMVNEKNKFSMETFFVSMKEIDPVIFKVKIDIVGFTKLEGEKEDFIMVESNYNISDMKEVEIYLTDESDKKRKALSILKLEQIVSPYLGIYKIKKGDKEILDAFNQKKKLYLESSSLYDGFLGTNVNPFSSSLKYTRFCKNCVSL